MKARSPRAPRVPKAKAEAKTKTSKATRTSTNEKRARPRTTSVARMQIEELESLRTELARRTSALAAPRWNADPEDVQRSVAKLVLALVEFLRKLLEKQAIRRMEADSLTPREIERVGVALMRLEETVNDMAHKFGLDPKDLNLDLGPLGRLT